MQVAVDHVNFTIEEGEFVVILGQSGAEKRRKPRLLLRIMRILPSARIK